MEQLWQIEEIDGIPTARRDYIGKNGEPIMVSFSHELAYVIRHANEDRYITTEEYLHDTLVKYIESETETICYTSSSTEDEVSGHFVAKDPLITELFERDIQKAIVEQMKNIKRILKEEKPLQIFDQEEMMDMMKGDEKEAPLYLQVFREVAKQVEDLPKADVSHITEIMQTFLSKK